MNARFSPPSTRFTVDSVRAMALRRAAAWNENQDQLRDNAPLTSWRDNCRDEVRDDVAGTEGAAAVLSSWEQAFDGAIYGVSDAADDIECAVVTVNDLLRLALDQLADVTNTRADAAIRGAKRFVDDIRAIALQLHSPAGPRDDGWNAASTAPDSDRDVLAWDGVDQLPTPAFYASEEGCWISKIDGTKFAEGVVTHWREIQAPAGGAQ